MREPFSLEKIHLSTGMRVSFDGRCYELSLDEPLGRGTMRTFVVSPWFLASTVDFEVERCPNLLPPQEGDAGRLLDDTWFSMNFCMEGRCEVLVPSEGFAVVGAGDFCVGYARTQPGEFRYPLGRYRGVELFVSTRVLRDPSFAALAETGIPLDAWVGGPDTTVVFSGDWALNDAMGRIGAAAERLDAARCKIGLMGLLSDLFTRDFSAARPPTFLTPAQMGMVRAVRDEVERAPAEPHDVRALARRFGVGAATLNGYFRSVQGMSVAAFVRDRRMRLAADLLASTCLNVAEVALRAGYSNPSKFAEAFKRLQGVAPSEYRRSRAVPPRGIA